MKERNIRLDHIAVYVTNIERSMKFYRDVLHMSVTGPFSLREGSSGLKYGHNMISHAPKMFRSWVGKKYPAAYQQMFTDICCCSAADGEVSVILVQQTHPEKGYTRSVTGNTLYGFSCILSADIDTDDLAWDLEIADITFQHGDPGTDGKNFSPDNPAHSLYITDPDGRMIELVPSFDGKKGDFLTGFGHIILYVSDRQKSAGYYHDVLGLSDITPPRIPREPFKDSITWLGIPGSDPVILLYQAVNPDGSPVPAGGYGLDHAAFSGIQVEKEMYSDPVCITGHQPERSFPGFILDPDGYHIEC
jgi:catechol 2,3-dioxygenase-like lactoylglutathione lyase family enzyme